MQQNNCRGKEKSVWILVWKTYFCKQLNPLVPFRDTHSFSSITSNQDLYFKHYGAMKGFYEINWVHSKEQFYLICYTLLHDIHLMMNGVKYAYLQSKHVMPDLKAFGDISISFPLLHIIHYSFSYQMENILIRSFFPQCFYHL